MPAQVQARFLSPYTLSTRPTAGQNFEARVHGAGKAASEDEGYPVAGEHEFAL